MVRILGNEFSLSEGQKGEIRQHVPKALWDNEMFFESLEVAVLGYRDLVSAIHESGSELKPHQTRAALSRAEKSVKKLRLDLNSMGALSGRALIESGAYHEKGLHIDVDKIIKTLGHLEIGIVTAKKKAKELKTINTEAFLVRTIKSRFDEYIGRPGTSRNCRCYKLSGLLLEYAGRPMDDWFHLYGGK